MFRCSKCGNEIAENAVVCPHCGYGVNASQVPETGKPGADGKMGKGPIVALGISGAVLTFAVFLFLCAQNASHAIMGKSALGLGRIFFADCVMNGIIKPVMFTQVIAGVVIVLSAAAMLCCGILYVKKK